MTTLPAPFIANGVVSAWEDEYPSATFSGIVGDPAHMRTGGYHVSIEDQSSTNYSVIRPDDKAPPGTWSRKHATALDMSMNKADMIKSTRRWMAVWADPTDPRRKFFNGFNGWLGTGDAQRWDFVTNKVQRSTNDHQWHQHTEKRRKYWNDPQADRAMISIARGQTKEQWIAQESSGQGDEMYAKYGDGNNGQPRSRNVTTMQNKLLLLDPNALPQFGPDGGYGDETTAAFVRLVPGVGDGKSYDEKTIPLMDKAFAVKFGGGGGGGLVDHTHDITGLTVTVQGSGVGNGATGPAKAV